MAATITRDGDVIIIKMPVKEAHGLQVALEECRSHACRESKSIRTMNIRDRLRRGLASAVARGSR